MSRNPSASETAACCSTLRNVHSGITKICLTRILLNVRTGKQSTRGGGKYLSRKLDFYIARSLRFTTPENLPRLLGLYAGTFFLLLALNAHVCGKLFMRLIKMNVFICLRSTKERSARARAGGVWWDEIRACALWVAVALRDAGLREVQSSWGGTDTAQSVWWGKQFKHLQKLRTSQVSIFPTDHGMHGLNSEHFYFSFHFLLFARLEVLQVATHDLPWHSALCFFEKNSMLTVIDFQTSTLKDFTEIVLWQYHKETLVCRLISMWSGPILGFF